MSNDDTSKGSFLSSISLILCSFLLVGFSQPDWSPLLCSFTALFGYALFWRGNAYWRRGWQTFFSAALWFAGVQALHVNWLTSTHYIGPLMLFGYVYILGVKGIQFGLLSYLVSFTKNIWGIAALWTLMEWSCLLFIFSGYAFNPIGLSLSASFWGLQFASLFGVLGLSFWVLLTNLSILRGKKFLAISCVLIPLTYGGFQIFCHQTKMEEKKEVLLVQAALPPEMRYQIDPHVCALTPPNQWRYMFSLLAPFNGEKFDLIVFPEGAVHGSATRKCYEKEFANSILKNYFPDVKLPQTPDPFVSNSYFAKALAKTFQAKIIIGLEEERYNVACYYDPENEDVQIYSKQQLVPFGEYMPMRKLLEKKPFCKWIAKAYSVASMEHLLFFEAGKEGSVLGDEIGVSVCYEEANGALMLKSRKNGAKMHVNISNDGWFPRSRLPVSHFFHGKIRSVEQGIPLVRACNIGVTCGVDSLGRVIEQLAFETKKESAKASVLKLSLPIHTYKTLYMYTGNTLIIAVSFLFLFSFLPKRVRVFSFLWNKENSGH